MAIFIVDDDVKVKFLNKEARKLLADETVIYDRRAGDVLRCMHAEKSEHGCGRTDGCKRCIVRNAVNEAMKGNKTYRTPTILELNTVDKACCFHAIVTATPFVFNGNDLVMIVLENANEVMLLRNIIPLCSHCKKVRNDEDYWVDVKQYFSQLVDVDFTYSICETCRDKLYPR